MNDFQQEWAILHADIEKYERFSLLIKLVAVLVCVLVVAYWMNVWLSVLFILILWLQDGIWKTFQSRLTSRILFIEQQLEANVEGAEDPFQYYSQWESQRQNAMGLVKEYLFNGIKPTVAYPYVVLIVITAAINYYVR